MNIKFKKLNKTIVKCKKCTRLTNFIKKISSIKNSQKTIKILGPSARIIAECEGLDAHAKSIQVRLNGK